MKKAIILLIFSLNCSAAQQERFPSLISPHHIAVEKPSSKQPEKQPTHAAIQDARRIYDEAQAARKKEAAQHTPVNACRTHPEYPSSESIRRLTYSLLTRCNHPKPHRVYVVNWTNKHHDSYCDKSHDEKLWGCINFNEKLASKQTFGYKKLQLFRQAWKCTYLHNNDRNTQDLNAAEKEKLELSADKYVFNATDCAPCKKEFRALFMASNPDLELFKCVFAEIRNPHMENEEYEKIYESCLSTVERRAPGMLDRLAVKRAFQMHRTHFGASKNCEYHSSPVHSPDIILGMRRIGQQKKVK